MNIEENKEKQHEWVSEWYYDYDIGDWNKDELDQGPCVNSE